MSYSPLGTLDSKRSVRLASNASINLSAPGVSLDGINFNVGDRFLAKDQGTPSLNGIWVWLGAAVPAERARDADRDDYVTSGMVVHVEEGTNNANTEWTLTTNEPFSLGASLTFQKTGVVQPISEEVINAKGDLLVGTAPDAITRHAAGANGLIPVYDSANADGLENRVVAPGTGVRIFNASGYLLSGDAPSDYILGCGNRLKTPASDARDAPIIYLSDSAISNPAGWTRQMLLLLSASTNATGIGGSLTAKLRPVASTGGGLSVYTMSLGAAAVSATANSVPDATTVTANSGWVAWPAADSYVLTVANANAIAGSSLCNISAHLFVRYV